MVSSLVAVLVTVGAISADNVSVKKDGAKWESNYTKALQATRKDDRPLLVVLDNPNKAKEAIDADQLELEGKQGELLESYQLCHVDVTTKYGKKVADAFHAEQFPFISIIDKKGEFILVKKTGQIEGKEWESTLKKYKEGEQPAKVYTSNYRGEVETSYHGEVDTSISFGNSGCKACQLRAMQGR